MEGWDEIHAGEDIIYIHRKTHDMWKKNVRTGNFFVYEKKKRTWKKIISQLDGITEAVVRGYVSPFI